MSNSIINYVPRTKDGKYSTLRRKMVKILIYQLIVLSVIMNVWQARQIWDFHCSVGGYFVRKDQCNQMAQNKFDSQQLAQTQNQLNELTNNQDLYK
jgi:hypothetical protein